MSCHFFDMVCGWKDLAVLVVLSCICICTRATSDSWHVKLMVNLLFTVMQSLAQDWAEQSAVHFLLLARLLSYLSSSGVVLSNCSAVLTKQIDTLTMGREAVLRTGHTATEARGSGRRADSGAGGGLDLPGLQALGGLQHLGPDPTQLHNHARLASARYLVSTLIFLISRSSLPRRRIKGLKLDGVGPVDNRPSTD